jgi:hypothetical protein
MTRTKKPIGPRTIRARKKRAVETTALSRAERLRQGWQRVEIIMAPDAFSDMQTLLNRMYSGTITGCIELAITQARQRDDELRARQALKQSN